MALEVAELFAKLTMDSTSFISGVKNAVTSSESMGQKIVSSSLAIGGSMTAVGGVLEHFGAKIEDSHIKLENVIKNTGNDFADFQGQIGKTITQMEKFGHGSADTQDALAKLTVRLNDPTKAMKDMSAVAEVAAFKHISLSEAADLVGKVAQGNAKILKQFGLAADSSAKDVKALDQAHKALEASATSLSTAQQKLTDLIDIQSHKAKLSEADHIALRKAHEAVAIATDKHTAAVNKNEEAQRLVSAAANNTTDNVQRLADKLKGVAEDQANTFHGKMDALKTKLEDFAGTLGQHVGPALVMLGPLLMGVGQLVPVITGAVGLLGGAMSFLAANPVVLIIGGLVLLGGALYEAYQHSETFRNVVNGAFNAVKEVISAVWSVIQPILKTMGDAIGAIANPLGTVAGIAGKIVGGVGGALSSLNPFSHATGGTVEGMFGAPQLIMAHGGERVIPASQAAMGSGGGGNTFNINVSGALDPDGVARAVQKMLLDLNRRTGTLGFT